MLGRAELGFALLALFLASAALFPLLRGVGGGFDVEPRSEDPRLALLGLAVYATAALLVFRRRVALLELLAANKLLFGVVALACASVAWSDSPATTARRALALVLTSVLGVYLATSFSRSELVRLVSWLLLGLVLASAAFAVLDPAHGLDQVRGNAWRGVFTTKNELGRIAVLGALVWVLRAFTRHGRVVLSLSAAAACVYALDRSGSKTGAVVLALLVFLVVLLPALRAHHSIAVPTAALFGVVALLAGRWLVGNADAALSAVGGDSTLTGRSEIWAAVWNAIQSNALLGHGFGAFWLPPNGPSWQVWASVGSTPPNAHNGVLDLWLDLGLVGVALIAGAFVVAAVRAARALRGGWSIETAFPACLLAFVLLFNVSESTLVRQHSLFFVLLVAVCVQLAPARRRARVPVPAPATAALA